MHECACGSSRAGNRGSFHCEDLPIVLQVRGCNLRSVGNVPGKV